MRPRRLAELAQIMGDDNVTVVGDPQAQVGPAVVIDSRRASSGALFVAIPGTRVDGHDFAPAAVDAGAAAVLGAEVTAAEVPHLLVADPVVGLSWLARGLVDEARGRGMLSLGITGSSGKTSAKDMLAHVLAADAATVAPEASLNNEIGVPLTACGIDDETRYLVTEMGARGIGHIAWLTSLVGLDVGIVLNVGAAHVGEFGSIAQTAQAKAEIVTGLPEDGWAVLNADDPRVAKMAEATKAQVAWFGEGDLPPGPLQVSAEKVCLDELSRASFELVVRRGGESQRAPVQLQYVGRHHVANALAAAAAAMCVGLPVPAVAAALGQATPQSPWRMELQRRSDDVLVLNDAYNANPDSMAAALRAAEQLLDRQREHQPQAKLVAVLGDMLELGADADDQHRRLARLAADGKVAEIVAVGNYATVLCESANEMGLRATPATRDEVSGLLQLAPGDVVVIKGSRAIGLEVVAQQLLEGEAQS